MFTTKIYKVPGGDELVVDAGGKITIKAGGTIENDGDFFTSVTFDADYFTVADGEVTIKSEIAVLLTLVSNIPTADPEVTGQVWNDGGVLKTSAGA